MRVDQKASATMPIRSPCARRKKPSGKRKKPISSSGRYERHHGKDGTEHEKKRENRKEKRLPAVTIASGLFRHRSSPFKKQRAANEVPVEASVAYGKRRYGGGLD